MTSKNAQDEAVAREMEFDAMHLQVGGRIQFITHRTIKPIQHFSALIGYVRDEYMIFKIPLEAGKPVALAEGDKLTIRVFTGVTVCSFPTSVLRIFPRPLNYVHLSFPAQIRGTSLRTAMRVKVDVEAQLACEDGSKVAVALVNLSVSGALIESATKLDESQTAVGLSFTLTAQPGNQEVPITARATIKNVSTAKSATPEQAEVFTYGVQFLELEPLHYSMLQNLTYEALIADRQKIV